MLKLSSNSVTALSPPTGGSVRVYRISENPNRVHVLRSEELLLVRSVETSVPLGFAGYLFFEKPEFPVPSNSFLIEPALDYLRDGDIIRLNPGRSSLRSLYRRNSRHNSLLVTERCNNFCLMCSQPPKDVDDSYLVDEILQTIPLMAPETRSIGITGGEPSLLGDRLVAILRSLRGNLPSTAVHVLSNGRKFKDHGFARLIAGVGVRDLMFGIPLYSDLSEAHDYVVQAEGAYDDTIRGIINLKSVGVRVEIRVVIHKATYQRLPELASFIRRNLTFCDHVAFMGLEMTGFTKINLDQLWIDPKEYQPELRGAVETLSSARIPVSIYNHQLCLLDRALLPYNVKSISDWKNEYMKECDGCAKKQECGGFFSSAGFRYSSHIFPFQD